MAITIERKQVEKRVSNERPIEIFFNGRPMMVSQGTPHDLSELAVGYLLSEGLLTDRAKFRSVRSDAITAQVEVFSDEQPRDRDKIKVTHRYTGGGCPESALLTSPSEFLSPITSRRVFAAEDIARMMDELCERSPLRNDGECVHGCGIGSNGTLAFVREDIGRHNAMDKLIGQAWLDFVAFEEMALFTTGRISFEMASKAIQSGVSVLVSHKSATDHAVEVAEKYGLTLVAKCRQDSMQVLTHHDRIV